MVYQFITYIFIILPIKITIDCNFVESRTPFLDTHFQPYQLLGGYPGT